MFREESVMDEVAEQVAQADAPARGFEVTDTSNVVFFDIKRLIERDFQRHWLLPPETPTGLERWLRGVSAAAGPIGFVAILAVSTMLLR